jgi:hypothetical protein
MIELFIVFIYIIFHRLYLYYLFGVYRVGHTFHLFSSVSYHLFNLHLYIIIRKLLIVIRYIYILPFFVIYTIQSSYSHQSLFICFNYTYF